MNIELEFIRYVRPKSAAFGNASKLKNPRESWNQASQFLENRTIYHLAPFTHAEIWAGKSGVNKLYHDKLEILLGKTDESSGTPYRWLVPNEKIDETIELVFSANETIKEDIGPLRMVLQYLFIWKDMNCIDPIPGQERILYHNGDYHSRLGIIVDSKIFYQADLLIPFGFDDHDGKEFLQMINRELPFKPSEKSFIKNIMYRDNKGKIKFKAIKA